MDNVHFGTWFNLENSYWATAKQYAQGGLFEDHRKTLFKWVPSRFSWPLDTAEGEFGWCDWIALFLEYPLVSSNVASWIIQFINRNRWLSQRKIPLHLYKGCPLPRLIAGGHVCFFLYGQIFDVPQESRHMPGVQSCYCSYPWRIVVDFRLKHIERFRATRTGISNEHVDQCLSRSCLEINRGSEIQQHEQGNQKRKC